MLGGSCFLSRIKTSAILPDESKTKSDEIDGAGKTLWDEWWIASLCIGINKIV